MWTNSGAGAEVRTAAGWSPVVGPFPDMLMGPNRVPADLLSMMLHGPSSPQGTKLPFLLACSKDTW